jgi:outer membrane lipoprotein-sorting protein
MLKAQDKQAVFSCEVRREEWTEAAPETVKRVYGILKIKAGGKARFDILRPSEQLLVCDGKNIWMVFPEAKQVMRQNAETMKTSGQFFLDLASSIRYYSKASQVRLIPVSKEFDRRVVSALELTPKDPATAGFDKAEVWVDTSRWVVQEALLTSGGSMVRARFTHIKTATPAQVRKTPSRNLPDSIFNFKTPEGYEVFDSLF